MPLNIKDADTHALAKRLASLTGESLTRAIKRAIQERLAQLERTRRGSSLANELDHVALHCANLPRRDRRSADRIIGYDECHSCVGFVAASVAGEGPAFGPEPQRQREVALSQRDQGAHRERVGTAVQGAGAFGEVARLGAAAGGERNVRPLPQAGRAAFNEQHLAQVGPAAVALGAAAVPGAAGRAAPHGGYSR